jgi:hypothetical protein
MADNEIPEEDQVPEKKWTDDDVTQKIKGRVKNLHSDNEELKQRIQELEAQQLAAQQAGASQGAPAPALAEAPPAAEVPQGTPQATSEGSPLTAEQMQTMLDNQHRQTQADAQQAQIARAGMYHHQNVAKMKADDDKFKKLEESTPLNIPEEVAVHLSNNLTHDQAKKLFTELLTNENSNLKMQNAHLTGRYNEWLTKMLNNTGAPGGAPEPVPELGQEANTGAANSADDSQIMDYLKKL